MLRYVVLFAFVSFDVFLCCSWFCQQLLLYCCCYFFMPWHRQCKRRSLLWLALARLFGRCVMLRGRGFCRLTWSLHIARMLTRRGSCGPAGARYVPSDHGLHGCPICDVRCYLLLLLLLLLLLIVLDCCKLSSLCLKWAVHLSRVIIANHIRV